MIELKKSDFQFLKLRTIQRRDKNTVDVIVDPDNNTFFCRKILLCHNKEEDNEDYSNIELYIAKMLIHSPYINKLRYFYEGKDDAILCYEYTKFGNLCHLLESVRLYFYCIY